MVLLVLLIGFLAYRLYAWRTGMPLPRGKTMDERGTSDFSSGFGGDTDDLPDY